MPPITSTQKAAISKFVGFTQAKESVATKVRSNFISCRDAVAIAAFNHILGVEAGFDYIDKMADYMPS